ncbi:hypothetical protein PG913_08045 [Tenacibaculum pacificus]|uniref:hypothetical protein n=1 Tax=Tenacibaculum pacificus TaxID=3018314 RepID=UPI0022F3AF9C|nr:hypothetical protein [Tenacibaculum pacificus]WBX72855.1 hypothetical protein PG913_08045 [Tenacibaculum pacificus]
MRKTTIILITFGLLLNCSPKIKSILEYHKKENEFVLRKSTEFDKNGNQIKSIRTGGLRCDMITTTEYKNNKRTFEKTCCYFKEKDTCYLQSFSTYEFKKNTYTEKEIRYESDSAVRFIREIKTLKNIKITNVFSWEIFPTKKPDLENAIKLIDTTYLDNKGRKIKSLHYNAKREKPWIEIFKYNKDTYSRQTIGTSRDTTLIFQISELKKMAKKNNIDYEFYNQENYKYEIENY